MRIDRQTSSTTGSTSASGASASSSTQGGAGIGAGSKSGASEDLGDDRSTACRYPTMPSTATPTSDSATKNVSREALAELAAPGWWSTRPSTSTYGPSSPGSSTSDSSPGGRSSAATSSCMLRWRSSGSSASPLRTTSVNHRGMLTSGLVRTSPSSIASSSSSGCSPSNGRSPYSPRHIATQNEN